MMQHNVSLVKYTTAPSKSLSTYQIACRMTSAKTPKHVEKV